MRIGLVTGEYPPMEGGVGAHCRELAREFASQGHDVFVYSDTRAAEQDKRIRITHNRGRWGIRALRNIDRWAKENRLDIVNLHFQTAAYAMSPYVHFLPDAVVAPVVTTFHDLRFPYLFPKAGRLRTWIVMRLARASEGVVSTNHEDFARLRHLPRTALIPIGSSVRGHLPSDYDRDAIRTKYGASPEDFVVAHFGFVNHTKGVDTLLEAAQQLNDDGIPVKVWLVGGRTGSSDPTNAAYATTIERLVKELELGRSVTWTGFLNDMEAAEAFAACDVVALLFRDGASYRRSSLMAAIRHGCAILTTTPVVDVPAFRDGTNMLFTPCGEEDVAAERLALLFRDPGLVDALRQGARELARSFAWGDIARANVELFARVVTETAGKPS